MGFKQGLGVLLLALALGCAGNHSTPVPKPSVGKIEVAVLGHPRVLNNGSGQFAVYDLVLTNVGPEPARVRSISTTTNQAELRLMGKELSSQVALAKPSDTRVSGLDTRPIDSDAEIIVPANGRLVFFGWSAGKANALKVTVDYAIKGKPLSSSINVALPAEQGRVIKAPLQGGGWFSFEAPSNRSRHRRSLYQVESQWLLPQRFAVDFVRTNRSGQRYSGDPGKNESFFAYGADVYAVGDGKVVEVTDGIPDNPPACLETGPIGCKSEHAVPMTRKTLPGNKVVLEVAPDYFVTYAHLQSGSIPVKNGDMVQAGQMIGKIGNSGNSSEPHLHFHACDRPSSLECDGVPTLFERFVEIPIDVQKGPTGPPQMRQGQMPINSAILIFPDKDGQIEQGGP